jgi:hypothetical protein
MRPIFIFLILLVALSAAAMPPAKTGDISPATPKITSIDNTSFINANKILMFVTNHANWGRDLSGVFGYDYGTFYPYVDMALISNGTDTRSPYYAGGLWIGAVDSASGDTLVTLSEYMDEYVPGPMFDGTYQADNSSFRVHKLYSDSLVSEPNQDYLEYMQNAILQGAPHKVTDCGDIVPEMKGDQMLWSVCNDANPAKHQNNGGSRPPMGIEVRNTTYAYNRSDYLGNVIFIRLQIYNKGTKTLQNCHFSIWSDPDLGSASDDLIGCDTTVGLGYVYNATNNDSRYGSTPPSLGVDLLQGPLSYTGNPADTGKMWGITFPRYKNLGLYSFNKYINGTDPDNYRESFYYMRGLTKTGSAYIYDGKVLRFVCSGNPIMGTGDLDYAPSDRRFMLTTEPITFRPGDSTEILAALIIGQGGDRLASITMMKSIDQQVQSFYENEFVIPAAPVITGPYSACAGETYCISWNSSPIATSYEIRENGGVWTDIGNVTHKWYEKPSSGLYVYSVRAKNNEGISGSSNNIWVTVITAPEKAVLLEPADNEIIDTLKYLSWERMGYAINYHLQIADNLEFGDPLLVDEASLSDSQFEFQGLPPNVTLYWRVRVQNVCGWGEWSDTWRFVINPTDVQEIGLVGLPKSFALDQNYPNPFNPTTVIEFSVPYKSYVAISIYNLLGTEIIRLAEGEMAAGRYQVEWNGRDEAGQAVSTGIYFYRLQAGDYIQTKKMVLLK